jgi:hypothetical protein
MYPLHGIDITLMDYVVISVGSFQDWLVRVMPPITMTKTRPKKMRTV